MTSLAGLVRLGPHIVLHEGRRSRGGVRGDNFKLLVDVFDSRSGMYPTPPAAILGPISDGSILCRGRFFQLYRLCT